MGYSVHFGYIVVVFLEDVLISSCDDQEYKEHLRQLERLEVLWMVGYYKQLSADFSRIALSFHVFIEGK